MLTSNTDHSRGLAAGVRAGARGGAVLFADREALGHSAKSTIHRNLGRISRVVLMGGTDQLSSGVEADLDFEPAASGSIGGTVRSRDGSAGLEGVKVTAWGLDPGDPDFRAYRAHSASSAPDGSYAIDHLEPGEYWLTFEDPSGRHAPMSYPAGPFAPAVGDRVRVEASPAPHARADASLLTTAAWEAQRAARIAGADRYATALAISRSSHAQAGTVVLTSGEGFADALSASALAGAYGAPLLLTRPTSLPAGLTGELERLKTRRLVVVGGERAVSAALAAALAGRGLEVTRVAGADRYDTSAAVYRHLNAAPGLPVMSPKPFVARGDRFPDALAAAPLAYGDIRPILLVKPSEAPSSVVGVVSDFAIGSVTVLGGTAAVSDEVLRDLGWTGGPGGLTFERLHGADRYSTAVAIARSARPGRPFVAVASGQRFPDALAGGVLAGSRGGLMLLTPPSSLAPETGGFLAEGSGAIQQMRVFGGTMAVGSAAEAQARAAIAR